MSDQVEKYQAYARFIRVLLIGGGIWPGSKPSFFYRVLPIFSICSGIVLVVALGNFCWQNAADLSLVTKACGLFGSFSAVVLKIYLFCLYQKELRNIYNQLQSLFEEALEDPLLQSPLLSSLRYIYRVSVGLTVCASGLMSMHTFRPLIVIMRQEITGAATKVYPLAFPGSYPWSVHSSTLVYVFHYIFEAQFSWTAACITGGVDSLFAFYMYQMSGILRVLTYKIHHVKETDDHQELLRNCIKLYSRLIHYAKFLETVYGPIVVLMAVTNGFILCSTIFQAVQSGGMSVGKAVLSFIYMSLKLSQTFMYAWGGHFVTEESENLQREIYCSDWYDKKPRAYKTGVLLLLMQRPIILTACNFFNISLDFFVKILSTTLSYFCLLQTLDDSE